MNLGSLVYMVVREVSKSDFWLNLFSTLGTFIAIGLSLYLARRETSIRRAEEESRKNNMRLTIGTILHNANTNFSLIESEIKKQTENFPLGKYGVVAFEVEQIDGIEPISQKAFDAIQEFINKNIGTYILNANSQLSILLKLDVNAIPVEVIREYSEAIEKLILLIKWTEEVVDGPATLKIAKFLEEFYQYYTPVNDITSKLNQKT